MLSFSVFVPGLEAIFPLYCKVTGIVEAKEECIVMPCASNNEDKLVSLRGCAEE